MFSRRFQCRNRSCWAFEGYRSRRRTFLEKYLLRLFLLKPVRCADCFRRVYVPLWVHARFEKDVAGLGPRIWRRKPECWFYKSGFHDPASSILRKPLCMRRQGLCLCCL